MSGNDVHCIPDLAILPTPEGSLGSASIDNRSRVAWSNPRILAGLDIFLYVDETKLAVPAGRLSDLLRSHSTACASCWFERYLARVLLTLPQNPYLRSDDGFSLGQPPRAQTCPFIVASDIQCGSARRTSPQLCTWRLLTATRKW